MTTPHATKSRISGIPTPGRPSAIPTPGRYRSSSSAALRPPPSDDEYAAEAFQRAMNSKDPSTIASQSGRTSVADRAPSVASTSSSLSRSTKPDFSRSTTTVCPASRASDTFARSVSRADRNFSVGDRVRIKSKGEEGTLRYIGPIDGKDGIWAGVELLTGFTGLGKNDGSVEGKRYFHCPDKRGVFIHYHALRPPSVNAGSISRPASVASSRNGRTTPATSGRITPSNNVTTRPNGRVQKTPTAAKAAVTLSGRVTPTNLNRQTPGTVLPTRKTSNVTPSSRTRSSTGYLHKTPVRQTLKEDSISNIQVQPGSRAAKYLTQFGGRGSAPGSPSGKTFGVASPTKLFNLGSPAQGAGSATPRSAAGSPFQTPRTPRLLGHGTPSKRASIATSKGQLPSELAMLPPSPARSTTSSSDRVGDRSESALSDIQYSSKVIQSKMAAIMSSSTARGTSSRPGSAAAIHPVPAPLPSASHNAELQNEIERLRARLDAAEDENTRLKVAVESAQSTASAKLGNITSERDKARARVTELETSARASERLVKERDATIESLERSVEQLKLDVEKVRGEGEAKLRDTQSKLDDKDALVKQLKQLVDAKEGEQSQNDALLDAKNAEIALLEARVQKAYTELEDERRELNAQIDELRKAGQETIALYEERLSAADNRRYEMEDLIASLEDQLRAAQARADSPSIAARQASSAAEIDNETLRIQVQHLTKKIASLEDTLDEARVTAQQEEQMAHDRILKYKEQQDALRLEIAEGQKENQKILKAEQQARGRVAEVEEALRENTATLENARAEIESLRIEVAHLESIATNVAGGSPPKSSQLLQEVSQLRLQLAEERSRGNSEVSLHPLKEELDNVKADKEAMLAALEKERQTVSDLLYQLEERNAELETTRKKLNRELPVNGLQEAPKGPNSPSKRDYAAKEEIKGLKHIIQELQKENNIAEARNKKLGAENEQLGSEINQLTKELKELDLKVEQSLILDGSGGISDVPEAVATLHQTIRDLTAKYEAELAQLHKTLAEAEKKHAAAVNGLQKDVGELETLLESKIYREEELELEIQTLQEKLARSQKKSSKGPAEDGGRSTISRSSASTSQTEEQVCEICEQPGHDILECSLMNGGVSLSRTSADVSGLFCEDCEERGHTAKNCLHSLDVF